MFFCNGSDHGIFGIEKIRGRRIFVIFRARALNFDVLAH